MAAPSYTATDSFAKRVQRVEAKRATLMVVVFAVAAALYLTRRLLGGVVMRDDRLFFSIEAILALAIAFEVHTVLAVRAANRGRTHIPGWKWGVGAAIELAVPVTILFLLQLWSPRGHVPALSAPVILMLPLVVMLSTMHLRAAFTLWTGLAAAAAHSGLVLHAIFADNPAHDTYPVMFSYTVYLTLIGVAGALLAREIRGYVREAVDEGAAHEAVQQRITAVEHDLEVAREIQRGLIPTKPPDLPGYDIAGVSKPADLTGGDYYDWQTLPDGRTAFVIADVTGHGIGPAIVMAVCRAYARASAPLMSDLKPLLERLNDLIHGDVHGDRFVTFAMAVLDPRTHELEILSAGHGPSLLFRGADGHVDHMGGDGLPLGVVPGEEYDAPTRIALQPGDSILLLTDGYFEWRRECDNKQFGIKRVADVFSSCSSADARGTLGALDEAVHAFVGTAKQDDDMTAVVIKRI